MVIFILVRAMWPAYAKLVWLVLLLALPGAVQAQWLYTTNNGAITITGYNGPGGAVAIPGAFNGLTVTSISGSVFLNRTDLTSVTMSNGIGSIGQDVFYG